MRDKLVSVVIPCYNQAHFLDEAINSVLAQTYPRCEIIVIDDGSTDATAAVAARHERVRCIGQENQGLSAARNRGLRESRGEYLVFLDADDRLLPEALRAGVTALESNPDCAFVYGRYLPITADGAPLPAVEQPLIEGDAYLAFLRANFVEMHATVMYQRAVLNVVGGFDTALNACEDYDLYLRVTRDFPIKGHQQAVAEYRQHGASMSRHAALMLRSALAVLRAQQRHIRGKLHYEQAYQQGIGFYRRYYGKRLAAQPADTGQRGALSDRLTLLRHYPRGLLKHISPALYFQLCRLQYGAQNAIIYLRRRARGRSVGKLGLHPNPIQLSSVQKTGAITLSWTAAGATAVEVRVDAPDGPLLSQGSATGSATTNEWVRDRMSFFLQDVSAGLPLTTDNTLAHVVAHVVAANKSRAAYGTPSHPAPPRQHEQSVADLVSVIIPCYNQAHFLDEAINSVLAQTYPRYQIIVIDDGSTDDTAAVAARHEGVSCIRQENQGLSAARNRGLGESQGEYLVFLDADDRLLPGALAVGVECLVAHPECILVYGGYQRITGDGAPHAAAERPVLEGEAYPAFLRANPIGAPAAAMYRRAAFAAVGGFDTANNPAADYDLYLRIAKDFPVYCHSEVVAEYRQHGANMSRDARLMLRSTLAVLRAQRRHIEGKPKYEQAYQLGIKGWREYYGNYLAAQPARDEWGPKLRDDLTLLRHFPRGLLKRLSSPACVQFCKWRDAAWNSATRLRRQASGRSVGMLRAHPNPIQVYGGQRMGATTLSWTTAGATAVEVRVDAPDGPLLSHSGPAGSATTGAWVRDGMTFFLQDVSEDWPLASEHTLAVVTVNVISSGAEDVR